MDQVKANFRGKRSYQTRAFFKESRNMTESYPELYSPEKPYENTNCEPKHVMKLIGSLYEPRKAEEVTEASSDESEEIKYETRVMDEEQRSAKKVRSASARASHTEIAMRATIAECHGI